MKKTFTCMESRSACKAEGSSCAFSTMCTLMPPGSGKQLLPYSGIAAEAVAESICGRLVRVATTDGQSQWGSATLKLHHGATSALCWLQIHTPTNIYHATIGVTLHAADYVWEGQRSS